MEDAAGLIIIVLVVLVVVGSVVEYRKKEAERRDIRRIADSVDKSD